MMNHFNTTAEIASLYKSFGYLIEKETDEYVVMSYGSSVYPGVDIIVTSNFDNSQYEQIKSAYSEAGYATNRVDYSSIDELEDNLFEKFFKPHLAKTKLIQKYNDYTSMIMQSFSDENNNIPNYKYFEAAYRLERDFESQPSNGSIIESILSITKSKGAQLVIVEAPAGFGKTSTAYEVVFQLSCMSDNSRPFLMELERERQASTFSYLLVHQMDKVFDIKLGSNLVIDYIKKGRIPLIIDGFDELLSMDMDEGKSIGQSQRIDTMLSTIGEMLTNESKIILTSRKTAIFSNDRFIDWVYNQHELGHVFTLTRFEILGPDPSSWLDSTQLGILPNILTNISNPVLLSFLRYRYDFTTNNNQPIAAEDLVNNYLDSILSRERTRQDIPLKNNEQLEVLMKLAEYFAEFDITTDNRKEISDVIAETNSDIIKDNAQTNDAQKLLINRLTNHALLDRHTLGQVGFLNDFVFGFILGKWFSTHDVSQSMMDSISLSTAVKLIEACQYLNHSTRIAIADAIDTLPKNKISVNFYNDLFLKKEISRRYTGEFIDDKYFNNLKFAQSGALSNCTFRNCEFEACVFDGNKYQECYFFSCKFKNCIFDELLHINSHFFQCTGIPITPQTIESANIEEIVESTNNLDCDILNKFRCVGGTQDRPRYLSCIIKDLSDFYPRKDISKRIDRLLSEKYIFAKGDIAWILKEGTDFLLKNTNHNTYE